MRRFKQGFSCLIVVLTALSAAIVQADVFNMGPGLTSLELVPVGNPGNVGEGSGESYGGLGPNRICGAVNYTYNIGKYEVSNAQYAEFLNAKLPTISDPDTEVMTNDTFGLYNRYMETQDYGGINYDPGGAENAKFSVKSGYANRPVVYVSWYDGIRFANWLQNGQGTDGSTESGTYTIDGGGKNSGTVHIPTAADRASWTWANPRWVLPSEDEWYKAAYHKNDGATGNYWDYPTSTNAVPYSDDPPSLNYPANSANYWNNDGIPGNGFNDGYAVASPYLTDVGDYALSLSPYGTLDQGGNVFEWNEELFGSWHDGSSHGVRGGDWYNASGLAASYRSYYPTLGSLYVGFRVASVPEPGSVVLLCIGVISLLAYAWRRRRS